MKFYWVEQGVVLGNKIKVQGERLICVNQELKSRKSLITNGSKNYW